MNEKDIIAAFRVEDCTRCKNECAVACPVYRHYGARHPRELAHLFLGGGGADHPLVWECVTCGACTEACPFKVPFADFVRALRVGRSDYRPVYGGLIHAYQRRQAAGMKAAAAKARAGWIDKSLDVNRGSDVVLFAGCLSLFDAVAGAGAAGRFAAMARGAVRNLNRLGVAPTILEDERCCGRDLYDIGEREAFAALARHNAAELRKARAKTVVTVCPECAFTLKDTYGRELGEQPYAVQHITELLAVRAGELRLERGDETFAFHDPCYLCRGLGVEDAPRTILGALSVRTPVELERRGRSAPCCGAGSWIDHGPHTRTTVDERLVEAHRAGAGTLVTSCPKCTLLYAEVLGATSWRPSPVEVKDLVTLAAERLGK